jgi:hypothetical protein
LPQPLSELHTLKELEAEVLVVAEPVLEGPVLVQEPAAPAVALADQAVAVQGPVVQEPVLAAGILLAAQTQDASSAR